MSLASILLLTAAIALCDNAQDSPKRETRGTVSTATAVTVTQEGETVITTSQTFTQEPDSTALFRLETTGDAPPLEDRAPCQPEPFAPLTFEEAVEQAECEEAEVLARHKTPAEIEAGEDNRNWF